MVNKLMVLNSVHEDYSVKQCHVNLYGSLVKCYVERLSKKSNESYTLYLFTKEKAIRLGTLDLESDNKQTSWVVDKGLDIIEAVGVVKEGSNIGDTYVILEGFEKAKFALNGLVWDALFPIKHENIKGETFNTKVKTSKTPQPIKYVVSTDSSPIGILFRCGKKVTPFEDGSVDWVKVSLVDLVNLESPKLPLKWVIGKFVSDAYYKWNHLLLGKTQGENKYYLGIPDSLSNADGANLDAHCECFKPCTSEQGYWMVTI